MTTGPFRETTSCHFEREKVVVHIVAPGEFLSNIDMVKIQGVTFM